MVNFDFPKKYLEDKQEGRIANFSLGDHHEEFIIWLNKPHGNFLITGKPGRKKTYLACHCALNLFSQRKISDYLFCNISQLYQEWLFGFSSSSGHVNYNMMLRLQECNLLIMDDLGTKVPSESFLEYLYCIVNARCNDPSAITIYTTNLNSQELDAAYGSRMVSRISDGLIITMNGPDARIENKAPNFSQDDEFNGKPCEITKVSF